MIDYAVKTFHLRFLTPCGVKRTKRVSMDLEELRDLGVLCADGPVPGIVKSSRECRERVHYEPDYIPTASGVALRAMRTMCALDRATVGLILGMGEIQIRWIEEGEADFDNDSDARQALALVALGRPA